MIPIVALSWKECRWSKGNGDNLIVYSKWLYQPHYGINLFFFDIRAPTPQLLTQTCTIQDHIKLNMQKKFNIPIHLQLWGSIWTPYHPVYFMGHYIVTWSSPRRHLFYTPSHLSELQSFKSIIPTNISGIFIFKQYTTFFRH